LENKLFSESESQILSDIILHRRDIRGNRFTNEVVEEDDLREILLAGINAPSVGFSQPWKFVVIRDQETKKQVHQSFLEENAKANTLFQESFSEEQIHKSALYSELKLEGVLESPVNIAVYYTPSSNPTLGQTSMKEVGLYSVVCAIQNMWLKARSLNLGMGWVSIIEPKKVNKILNSPNKLKLVAYLCLGHVSEFPEIPELETLKWEKKKQLEDVMIMENFH
jgi:5,6-dimethylbenzimidazole synthase